MMLRGARLAAASGRQRLVTAAASQRFSSFSSIEHSLVVPRMFIQASSSKLKGRALSSATAGKKDDANFFLDNLGKIFMGTIALVILSIVRSSKGRTNKITLRGKIEDTAALDPLEIDDLRVANSELTPSVFDEISISVKNDFPSGTCSYWDFVKSVRTTMTRLKGQAFTVELGHLLDRAVMGSDQSPDDQLPLEFHLTLLSLALNSTVEDRMRTLYKVLELEGAKVTLSKVQAMVGYLQQTCQLIPDAQCVETSTKYPIQTYRVGTPEELVKWEGSKEDEIDLEAFADILCTRSVCAWGECHNRSLKVTE